MTPDVVREPYEIFIGVDVDKRSFALTAVDGAGLKHSGKMPSDPEQLYRFIQDRYGGCRVLCTYEAGPTGYHLYDYLQERGQACQVVSPLGIPKPPNQVVKNNRLDSERLAVESRKGDLTPIRVPQGSWRELRHLAVAQANYAQSRKLAKQRIQALLLYAHLTGWDSSASWSHRHDLTPWDWSRQVVPLSPID